MLQDAKVKPGMGIGVVHIVVVTAEAISATILGHAVSCTEATLSSDNTVACALNVALALTGVVELRRPVGTAFVGKDNASSEQVKKIAQRASKRDMSKNINDK